MTAIKVKKVNMTQIFEENGVVSPVTLVVLVDSKGQTLDADFQDLTLELEEGDIVTVSGVSKGKGFQGVVKRHGFHGGPRSHGQKHSEREPGSIGIGGVQKVMKGMRMAGRMGGDKVTIKNLKIVKVVPESKEVYISGAIPGRRGTLLDIKKK